MKNDRAKLIMMSVLTMGAVFLSIAGSAFSQPSTTPPGGNVIPTFSGLTVNGSIETENLGVSGVFDLHGAVQNSTVEEQCVHTLGGEYCWTTSENPVSIFDNLSVNGTITAEGNGTIGSFYTRNASLAVQPDGSGGDTVISASCETGDYATGCSSAFIQDSYLDRSNGEIMGANFCTGMARNLGGTGNDMLTVYVNCFDPQGINN